MPPIRHLLQELLYILEECVGGKLLYLRTNKKHPDIFLAICTLFVLIPESERSE